ncbi:MAG: biotin--[Prevotella sp.]|nr:biotin--[acetyl-CoA-carboxylase] ligase [Prevotella sp.]
MSLRIIRLAFTDSTNRYLRELPGSDDVLVCADYQTAGRGCGTNSWESERACNLLFSVRLHPQGIGARDQFVISMANALALQQALGEYAKDVRVKWPNDIYWHDRKMAGTLIETSVSEGMVRRCIIGTGLNVNQTVFRSDAPNPVSLCQAVGRAVDREQLLGRIVYWLEHYMQLVADGQWASVRSSYRQLLWRKDGQCHLFRTADGELFEALLSDVADDGTLVLLQPRAGRPATERRFGFKEVQFVSSARSKPNIN